VGRRQRVSIG